MTGISVSGSSRASSRVDAERCVSGSKRRMDSISSPKKSMRTGRSISGRVDIEDAAAQGDLAGHLDDIDAGIADGEQVLDQHVGQVLFAAPQVQGERGVVVAREEPHAGGFDGRDDEAWPVPRGDLPERGGARLLDLGVGREIFEGQHVVRGQAQDGSAASAPVSSQAASTAAWSASAALLSATRMRQGALAAADEERKIERAGGEGEAGDTSAPGAGAQMAAHTLEGLRVLQVREQFADEGQNHCRLQVYLQISCTSATRPALNGLSRIF